MIEGLIDGLMNVLQPFNLIILLGGILLGFIGGAIPGISGVMLVIILLPISYIMDPIPAFLLLTSIYAISIFSGAISAILFRTPGTPESVATVLDGYPMNKKGEGGVALGIAITSSAIGGIGGTIFLIFLTPLLAAFALNFSSPEYFALAFMGLTVVAALSGNNLAKGLIGVIIGLFIATIGIDPMTGSERFTFGSDILRSGIDFIPVLIGLFAIAEVFKRVQQKWSTNSTDNIKTQFPGAQLMKKLTSTITRSSLVGFFIGVLPGIGATTASMLAYSQAASVSKTPERFGKGAPEGVAAPESANNAAAMGAMVPLLSLGIPGSATTAIILGAFVLHGIQPGPLMFETQTTLVYTIFIGLLIANIVVIFIAKPIVKIFSKVLLVPYSIVGPLIIMFCIVGTYGVRNSIFDVGIMFLFGLLGYFLEKGNFPLAPIVLGIVLGPIAEEHFRRSMMMGDITIFFTRPISLVLLTLTIISLMVPLFKYIKKRRTSGKN